jgi:hypothetical protein
LLVKHRTAAKIKKFYQKVYGEEVFSQEYERFKTDWEKSHFPIKKTTLGVREFREAGTQTEEIVLKEEISPFSEPHHPFSFLSIIKMEDYPHAANYTH